VCACVYEPVHHRNKQHAYKVEKYVLQLRAMVGDFFFFFSDQHQGSHLYITKLILYAEWTFPYIEGYCDSFRPYWLTKVVIQHQGLYEDIDTIKLSVAKQAF
jgi:hypothetical protein